MYKRQSLYPVIYSLLIPNWFLPRERAKAISLMLTSLLFSNIIGGPLAGVLLDTTFFGLHGWRTLFIVEALPAVIFAFIFAFWMKEKPEEAAWVTDAEKKYIKEELAKEEAEKQSVKKYTIWQEMCIRDRRLTLTMQIQLLSSLITWLTMYTTMPSLKQM